MSKPDAYIICTSPRSGSTLLCGLLRDSGVAGDPQSYFHRTALADWRAGLNLPDTVPLPDILNAAKSAGTAGTGMFGLRLQRHSAAFFFEQLARQYPQVSDDVARFEACFGETCFIHLTRQNKVEQSVSLVRALQSGLWHLNADGTEHERTAPDKPPHYDQEAIAAEYKTLNQYDVAWQDWFAAQNIAPLRITYEDLATDPIATTRQVLSFLEIEGYRALTIEPELRKLADSTSADWVALFLSDPVNK